MPELIVNLENESTTQSLGIALSELIKIGDIILLEGEITENCISNIVFSGSNGEYLSTDWSSK